ncbi:MAG: phosphotransferase [Bacilli bacterium]|nr:phosphotransferase [Bacilli bacterium]
MKLIALFDEKNYKQRSGIIREAVRAIIVKNNKIALVKSLKENHYKFPGGGIELGESHIDTLIRETKEETGLIIKPSSIKECGFIHEIRKSIFNDDAFEQISYYYFAEVEDEVTLQELSDREKDLQYVLEWVDPVVAYNVDTNLGKEYNNKFLLREACILNLLINNPPYNDIYSNIIKKDKINKGFSLDTKYCVYDKNNNKYLLRISSMDKYQIKLNEFNYMNELINLSVNMCKPIEFGICDEGVYSIQSWIDGVDARDYIPTLTKEDQYKYGILAGIELKKIHMVNAPLDAINWEERFNKKIDRKLKMYEECPLKYEKGDLFIEYINNNRYLLKDRPNTFQHGDYHIGNMMINKNNELVVIDFDRDDYGDPWEEFNRLVWSIQVSHEFATGIVDGYFNKKIPDEFWNLLALYMSVNSLSSLPWAIPYGEGEVNIMINQSNEILDWYDDMKRYIPKWYKKDNNN